MYISCRSADLDWALLDVAPNHRLSTKELNIFLFLLGVVNYPRRFFSWCLNLFHDAVAKYHRLACEHQKFIAHSSGGGKSEVRKSAWLSEGPLKL